MEGPVHGADQGAVWGSVRGAVLGASVHLTKFGHMLQMDARHKMVTATEAACLTIQRIRFDDANAACLAIQRLRFDDDNDSMETEWSDDGSDDSDMTVFGGIIYSCICTHTVMETSTDARLGTADDGEVNSAHITARLGCLIHAIKEQLLQDPTKTDGIKEALMFATMEEDFTLTYDLHGTKRFDAYVKPTLSSEKYMHTLSMLGSLLELGYIDRVMTIGCMPDPFFQAVSPTKCMWVYLNDAYSPQARGIEAV